MQNYPSPEPQSHPVSYPSGQPPQPGQYAQPPMQHMKPKKKRGRGCLIGGIVTAAVLVIIVIAALNTPTQPQAATPTQAQAQPTTAPTTKPTSKPTTAPAVIYPPKTQADLHVLAAKGTANAIHEFHSESVGLTGACPQPKRLVTVDKSVTGQALAQDLLAYFYSNHLDSPCGSIVFVYHTQAEANGDAFTAGRINFDVADSSGQTNFDPNGTGLKHTLTLNIGGLGEQEYVVTY